MLETLVKNTLSYLNRHWLQSMNVLGNIIDTHYIRLLYEFYLLLWLL